MTGRISAAVLAGGGSRRMGRNKAMLELRGITLLAWQVKRLRALGIEDILVSGCAADIPGTRAIPDVIPGMGPLSGLHACLCASAHPLCLALSVDVPLVPTEALEAVVEAQLAGDWEATLLAHGGTPESLIGIYGRALSGHAEGVLHAKDHSMRAFLRGVRWHACAYDGPEALLINCNTPEDYARLPELLARYAREPRCTIAPPRHQGQQPQFFI